jgi:hypothetical protein
MDRAGFGLPVHAQKKACKPLNNWFTRFDSQYGFSVNEIVIDKKSQDILSAVRSNNTANSTT